MGEPVAEALVRQAADVGDPAALTILARNGELAGTGWTRTAPSRSSTSSRSDARAAGVSLRPEAAVSPVVVRPP